MKGEQLSSVVCGDNHPAGFRTLRDGLLLVLCLLALILACQCQAQPAPTPLVQAEPTATATETATWTPQSTSSPTPTWTLTATPSPLPPTSTPTPSETPSPTATPTLTSSPTPSNTPLPLPTPDGVYREVSLPILMYHYISAPPPGADAIRRDLSLPPEAFEAQLRYFKEMGYHSITFYDLVMHLQRGTALPEKPILFTFDDGYKDHFTNAFPLLRQYGFRGAFFPITAFLDERRPGYLSWQDVETMHEAGMEFGVHGYTHSDLRGQTVDYLVWQTLGPKQAVELRTGAPAVVFCYPLGRYDDQVIAVLRSAHYWAGVTTQQGLRNTSNNLFEIRRVRVRGADSVENLVKRIEYLQRIE